MDRFGPRIRLPRPGYFSIDEFSPDRRFIQAPPSGPLPPLPLTGPPRAPVTPARRLSGHLHRAARMQKLPARKQQQPPVPRPIARAAASPDNVRRANFAPSWAFHRATTSTVAVGVGHRRGRESPVCKALRPRSVRVRAVRSFLCSSNDWFDKAFSYLE